jgi:hypothetical protein
MAHVKRYFVGYPKPRVSRMPFVILGVAGLLGHPKTADTAAAALQPIKKVEHDPIGLSAARPIALPLEHPPPESPICGGPPRSSRSSMMIEGASDREQVPVGWTEDGIWPTRSVLKRMTRQGLRDLRAQLRVCADSGGRVITVSCLKDPGEKSCTGEGDWWDDWIIAELRPWWDEHLKDRAIPRRRGCYILSYSFDLR